MISKCRWAVQAPRHQNAPTQNCRLTDLLTYWPSLVSTTYQVETQQCCSGIHQFGSWCLHTVLQLWFSACYLRVWRWHLRPPGTEGAFFGWTGSVDCAFHLLRRRAWRPDWEEPGSLIAPVCLLVRFPTRHSFLCFVSLSKVQVMARKVNIYLRQASTLVTSLQNTASVCCSTKQCQGFCLPTWVLSLQTVNVFVFFLEEGAGGLFRLFFFFFSDVFGKMFSTKSTKWSNKADLVSAVLLCIPHHFSFSSGIPLCLLAKYRPQVVTDVQ